LSAYGSTKKIEWIDDFQIGEQIDGDGKFLDLFRKHETREPVAVRILLPVHEMLRRRHGQRIARNARAAMRRRTQPHGLRPEIDRAVVGVPGGVVEADED